MSYEDVLDNEADTESLSQIKSIAPHHLLPIEGTTPETLTKTSTPVTPSATPLPTTRTTETESTIFTRSTTIEQTTSSLSTSPVTVTTSEVTATGSTPKTITSGPTPSRSTSPTPVTETPIHETTTTGTTRPPTGSHTTPVRTTTSGSSSLGSTLSSTVSPSSASTSPVPVTTSGTTPTKTFTTTSGTTSSSFTISTATTTSTTFKTLPPGSTSTSGPNATSTAVTTTGSSTVTPATGSSSTTSLTPTTPKKICSILPNESYEQGESWWLCNCTKAICIEDNIVQVIPIICNPPPKPTCANKLSPVPVIDEDGCCWHWECDCYCTGWGDPHYMTFDGLYYSYQGNCTYVLVEEINKKVDNFGVYIDNYHCDTRDVVSCPRTLIVRHETQEVRMTTAKPNTLQVTVTVNNQIVALPYKKFGVSIYESGINRVVEIPELKMNVTYNGLSFSIRMPYSLFGNNTQGQCGTCNNNTADDCMLPNGNIAKNCETMADHWQVVDPSKPQCSPGLSPTSSPSTTPTQPCKESSICEILLGSVFKPCHEFVQPEKYYAACVFDSCILPNLDLECSSLQIYAATCADQGVCIDWRSHTSGVCSYECTSGKEYRACGPMKEPTCKSSHQNETSTKQVEGCFCPNGTMLYDFGVDVCVKTCGCVGVDMIPREFGEKFTVDCQDCICLEGEHGIVCQPHECPEHKVSCDGEGFYEVTEVNPEDSCCPLVTCKCNTSLCTAKAPKCSLGFEVHSHIPSGQCCPVYQCVPKGVCVHQSAEFLPNSSVFVDKCQNCLCTNEVNISTQLNIISCEPVPCNTYCAPGYEMKPVKGECCGRCVQTKCIIHAANNVELILSPGEFKNDPTNNCTIYSCVDIRDQLIASTSEITCPAFNEDSCKPGTISFLPNGCCKTCAPVDSRTPCSVRHREDFIVYKGCRSVDRVVMTECEGTCGTFSLYSTEANSMDHSCSCCRETRTTEKHVVLKCPGGHSMSHKYVYVESCSCQDTECQKPHSIQVSTVSRSECATWGNFHFHTFDHVKFTFPGTCTYIFASHCNDSYQDFNIQIRRSDKNNFLIYFTVTIDGVILEVKETGITVNGNKIPMPFSLKSILIEDTCTYFQVTSKLGLTLKWNWADTLLLDLEETYKGKICGLCGNYDGSEKNDLISDDQECPNNMEYMECGNSCADTCADPERSKICKAPCTDGCFCPPGSCHIDGGFHITTFDNKRFNFHGNCHYVLAKNTDDTVVVIGEIIQCGTSKTMTCLKNVLVTLGKTIIKICSCGNIYMNNVIAKLPVNKDGITIFRQSTFFIKILSSAGVQIRVQMKPVMQLSITVDHSFQNLTSGLCGNFNNIQTDDFRTATGAVEDSASAFGNSWKTRASCFDVEDSFEDPCSNSVDKEKFAQHWCALLSNTSSVFAACHSVVDPSVYIKKCMYDTCNAEKSEAALCSVLSTYSRDCASAGMTLKGWRQGICDPSEECPETMVYNYSVKYCNQSCRSLDEPDPLCKVQIPPMEGCGCPEGTYLNDEEQCVTPDDCPCYYKGKIVQPGNSFQEDKLMCTSQNVFLAACVLMDWYWMAVEDVFPKISVRVCMEDTFINLGKPSKWTATHGKLMFHTNIVILCILPSSTCNKRQWNCTDKPCKGTCTVYGNGHYMSFDGEKFDFLGDCDYILAQDFCPNNMDTGTFRIVIQNNACGKSRSICSLKITLIFESSEIRLLEGRIQEIATDPGAEKNYKVDLRGGYIVIETNQGMNFMWDQKTTVVVHVAPSFQVGCYPECSPDKPYFDEESRECVSLPNCTSCDPVEKLCTEDSKVCLCCYNGKTYTLNETVYGMECGEAVCGPNGEIIKTLRTCRTSSTPAQGENVSLPVNTSDRCAYSVCNKLCQIELIWAECKTGHAETLKSCDPDSETCPPASTPSATNQVPASPRAPVSDCLALIPPRKFNETWNFGHCQTATCLGEGNNIKLSSMTCPPQQLKICVNGFPFMKHYDETGCCEVFECQCICSGWGNEHYVTFDGTYYHFKENCTYVLVKSIHPDSHNFWIHIDNYYCGATDGAICSMSLIIFYSNSTVILTQAMEHGKITNLILFNNKKVVPDISKNGIRISSSGLYAIIEIPELEVYVSYSQLAFYIKLPYGKFYNNTMGLCGTCTNQKSDDAMKRNGKVIESFKDMALDWKAPYPTNRYCNPGVSETTMIEYHQHCEPSNLCKIIWTLTECHGVVPPQPYYEACVASGCSEEHPSTECQSMQTYAALCGLHGVCVDWRRQANGQCVPKGVCVSEGVEFKGFRYVEEKGQCCSQCQQVACVANFPFGNVTIEVGKSYKDPYDNCTQYTCTESAGQFSLTSTVKVCLPFEEANCVPGTVDVTSDGCCKTCIDLPHKCKRNVKEQYIVHDNCKSAAPVPVPFCEGMCSTYSVYSLETNEMEHKCICCHEKRSHKVKVELVCSKHKTVQFTYVYVDECGCVETKCPKRIT
ncbi:hypothetical protein BTVI_50229 [Pitangus sulphuratus]|nr:hypothetical protein BTVI_50229 [Pitangus sulphuratus]